MNKEIPTQTYDEFLESKTIRFVESGFEVPYENINDKLFDFQRDIVHWALMKGKACIFAGTGLGKTAIQLEWAKHVSDHVHGKVLIIAPLAVAQQTVHEGDKFGIKVNLCREASQLVDGINITNYEMLHAFEDCNFDGVVLDESSILKAYTGKVRTQIIETFEHVPYKLACTATPAPNDHMELGNHAQFIGVMSYNEMLSMFFVHDGGETSKWRLKGHSVKAYWEWVASWAVMLSNPNDIGYDGSRFDLPPLNINETVVDKTGYVVRVAETLQERRAARKNSINDRVKYAADIVNELNEPCIVWCDLNTESAMLTKAINGAVEIRGSHSHEYKEETMEAFSDGNISTLVTKPSIAGFGMNWQHCSKMIFVGLSDSFEQYYQAVRRCWRFGQTKQVDVWVVTSEKEGAVVKNIKRKEADFEKMLKGMIAATQEINSRDVRMTHKEENEYQTNYAKGENWELYNGDSVEIIQQIPDNYVHYSIYSPPFSSLYTYSNSIRDMGNCKTDDEFYMHFGFLADELLRILKPGRLMSVHCMNLPTSKQRDGVIGLKDFRGDLIRIFEAAGFIYHSEVCIWKDPVVAMQRTKALGLLHKQIKKDSTMSRQGIPDYLVTFRKPGENLERVEHTNESFPVYEWQKYASPIWMDINPSNTLQKTSAREDDDERHICPLQLDVIRRALDLWTNLDDVVFTPFAGIGSECFEAVRSGRKAIGIELKWSYYVQACKNLKRADHEANAPKQITFASFDE